MSTAIHMSGVRVTYGNATALDDVHLDRHVQHHVVEQHGVFADHEQHDLELHLVE